MKLEEMLEKRRLLKESPSTVTKDYVPYGVYSFNSLDGVRQIREFKEELGKLYYEFIWLGENIIEDFPNNAAEMILTLTTEFVTRLKMMQKEILSGNVALWKGDDGKLYWAGVPTNKFEDREKDIFAEVAHQKLVKGIEAGVIDFPDLYIWHKEPAVGKATWVEYDDRGFLLAGGIVHKEWEDLVTSLLVNSTEPIGMSQGIYTKDVVRDSEGTIIEYKPFEFTFLPHKYACNLLTSFTALEE